jgi:hypothetical protein
MGPFLAHGAWSLVIAGRRHEGRGGRCILEVGEVRGQIDPEETLLAVKKHVAAFGLTHVLSHPEGAPLVDAAARIGLHVIVSQMKIADLANEALAALASGEASLPPDPNVRGDLLALRMGETAEGFSIRLADVERYPSYAYPVMLALYECGMLPAPKVAPKRTEQERLLADMVRRNKLEYAEGTDDASF